VKHKKITWRQYDSFVSTLASKLKASKAENIYGIPRNGLVLAVHLSHKLGKPLITDPKKITKKTLVVDTISHTGKQLNALAAKVKTDTAVLHLHAGSRHAPTSFVERPRADEWLVYPWETVASAHTSNSDLDDHRRHLMRMNAMRRR